MFRSVHTAMAAAAALVVLTSCSGPARSSNVGSPEFYWQAATETYAAGNYTKTIDHLDRLIETRNTYSGLALPWSLVLTSGVASGYMELADDYDSGARVNGTQAARFRRKAAEYRTLASGMALHFAENVDKLGRLPYDTVPLAFGLPKGGGGVPPVLSRIANGIPLSPGDADAAQSLTVERGVLLAVCLAAGAPNDIARTATILNEASAAAPRETFGKALARMLDLEAGLYGRGKLDEPEKRAVLQQRSQNALAWAAQSGTALLIRPAGK